MSHRSSVSAAITIGFVLAAHSSAAEVVDLVLINAATNQEIRKLADGDTVDLSEVGRLNVRAVTEGNVGSVRFGWDDEADFRDRKCGSLCSRR